MIAILLSTQCAPEFADCFLVRASRFGLSAAPYPSFSRASSGRTPNSGYVIDALTSGSATRVINAKGEGLLTPREEQIVTLVAEGIGNREIAEQLGIKENTVKKSLLRTYDKLGVSNRVELVLYALMHRGSEKSAEPSSSPRKAPVSAHLGGGLDTNETDSLVAGAFHN